MTSNKISYFYGVLNEAKEVGELQVPYTIMIVANDSKLKLTIKKTSKAQKLKSYVLHLFLCVYLRQESDQISREKKFWNLR